MALDKNDGTFNPSIEGVISGKTSQVTGMNGLLNDLIGNDNYLKGKKLDKGSYTGTAEDLSNDTKSRLPYVNTIEDLKKQTKYAIGDVVEVLGYYAKGDGAQHPRQKKPTGYNGADAVVGVDGSIWGIVHSGEVNVSWFGAKGDGTTDDSVCLNNALQFSDFMKIDMDVYLKSSIDLNMNKQITCTSGVIRLDTDIPYVFNVGYKNSLFNLNIEIMNSNFYRRIFLFETSRLLLQEQSAGESSHNYKIRLNNINIINAKGVGKADYDTKTKFLDVLHFRAIGKGGWGIVADGIYTKGAFNSIVNIYAEGNGGWLTGCIFNNIVSGLALSSGAKGCVYKLTKVYVTTGATVSECYVNNVMTQSFTGHNIVKWIELSGNCSTMYFDNLRLFDYTSQFNDGFIDLGGTPYHRFTNLYVSKLLKKSDYCLSVFNNAPTNTYVDGETLYSLRRFNQETNTANLGYGAGNRNKLILLFAVRRRNTSTFTGGINLKFGSLSFNDPLSWFNISFKFQGSSFRCDVYNLNSTLKTVFTSNFKIRSKTVGEYTYYYLEKGASSSTPFSEFVIDYSTSNESDSFESQNLNLLKIKDLEDEVEVAYKIYTIDMVENVGILSLDTPYHATQMSKLGILDSYHNYLTELHEYEKSQNVQSDSEIMALNVLQPPVIPTEVEEYAKECNLI